MAKKIGKGLFSPLLTSTKEDELALRFLNLGVLDVR